MNCLDLFDRPIADFIHQMRDEDDQLIVFLHIPKTAGSSIQRDLGAAFKNGYTVDWQDVDRSWAQFISSHQRKRLHHVRGHINSGHLDMLDAKNIEYMAASFLRHPVTRILSNYRYCISAASPRQAVNRIKYASLVEFMDDCVDGNHMTNLLVGKCDSVQQAIEKMSQRFSFIGIQEFYDFCQSILMRSLGTTYRPRPRLNVTPKHETTTADEMSPSIMDRISETQNIDIGVFDFFYRHYSALADSGRRIAS